ncbi:hypothetical protein [Peptoniphilus rhinitidis]|uniref:hypothetical protein n=1 Tax=Peptoniphilus rhinitidis TaxID=1175452 RepID=UPI0003153664|nr:hypothetical protein [Peptoniphilus rhinitidis]
MKAYRFNILAYEEIDIKAENQENAEEIAQEYWDKNFRSMFGGVEFVEVVTD